VERDVEAVTEALFYEAVSAMRQAIRDENSVLAYIAQTAIETFFHRLEQPKERPL
jgi:hypothetical protein